MKKVFSILFAVFVLGFAASPGMRVFGEGAPEDAPGAKIELTGVTPQPKVWYLGRNWLQNPDQITDLLSNLSLSYFSELLWNPKANTVVYSDQWYGIYSTSITGGKPGIVFDGVSLYTGKELTLILLWAGIKLGGISPDSRFLYFSYNRYDESRGATMKVEEGDSWIEGSPLFTPACRVVMRLDLENGAATEIADSSSVLALSRSGKYLCWRQSVESKVYVRDLENGNTWTLPITVAKTANMSLCITPDDRSVIYSGHGSAHPHQLFRMPIEGGEAEQISTYEGGEIGESRLPFDCSPDGEWVLYKDVDYSRSVSGTVKSPDGKGESSYSKYPVRLCAFSLKTRETVRLVPYDPAYSYGGARFSPDGKSFCYSLLDNNIWGEENAWSMYVHNFDPEQSGNNTGVADAAPVGFALSGNRPNPFNPSTAIDYILGASENVKLAVYDITGRQVCLLVNGPMISGRHTVVWNGKDNFGRAVSSGVYLFRLTAGKNTAVRKMLLVR